MKYLVNTNHFEILQALYITLVQQAARGPLKMQEAGAVLSLECSIEAAQ